MGPIKRKERSMKTWMVGALVVIMAAVSVPQVADAKRLGSGKSSGLQRDMPARTAPDAPPAKPATPSQAAPAAAGAAAAAGTAAAAGKRSWLGPIAGIAAGLGLVALMSHLGLGEGFANFLMMALMAVAAFFLIRFLLRRFAGTPSQNRSPLQYAGQSAGSTGAGSPGSVAWPAPASGGASAGTPAAEAPAALAPPASATMPRPVTQAFVPATFDSEGFGRIAKMIFIRLQAANDARNLDDLRSFTTPEMYASIKLDLQDRGDQEQHTDVVRVDAQVLDVAEEDGRQIVSVRFHGLIKEDDPTAEATSFDEVWHLVKPLDDSRNWAIAGIEQTA
jgi:predicted lipid-binding transport protein (Tim44 family)